MDIVDAHITQASEIIKRAAFRRDQIQKWYLGQRSPCGAERDVVREMKCKRRRIDAEKDGDDDNRIEQKKKEPAQGYIEIGKR